MKAFKFRTLATDIVAHRLELRPPNHLRQNMHQPRLPASWIGSATRIKQIPEMQRAQPLMQPSGLSCATFLEIPASAQASTTLETSL